MSRLCSSTRGQPSRSAAVLASCLMSIVPVVPPSMVLTSVPLILGLPFCHLVVVVLCAAMPSPILVVGQQCQHQRPVGRHGLARMLGVDGSVLVCLGDAARLPIALCTVRVAHRQIVGPLVEVLDWVAAGGHHLHDEQVGVAHCGAWVVHELALYI